MRTYRGRHMRPRKKAIVRLIGSPVVFGSWTGLVFWSLVLIYAEVFLIQLTKGVFR